MVIHGNCYPERPMWPRVCTACLCCSAHMFRHRDAWTCCVEFLLIRGSNSGTGNVWCIAPVNHGPAPSGFALPPCSDKEERPGTGPFLGIHACMTELIVHVRIQCFLTFHRRSRSLRLNIAGA